MRLAIRILLGFSKSFWIMAAEIWQSSVSGTGARQIQGGMAAVQECAGLAQVVPQAGGRRLLGGFRVDPHTCARADARAAARPLPPAHPAMPLLLQGHPLIMGSNARGTETETDKQMNVTPLLRSCA